MINIKKGLDLPISGQPVQTIGTGPEVKHVALLASDYPGLRPSMSVEVGEAVKKGQVLFEDKKNPGPRFTAPASGTVVAINRGARRAFQSIVIEVDPAQAGVEFTKTPADKLGELSAEAVKAQLNESGLFTAFRTRPFDKVPRLDSMPHSIFVTAMDTIPLCAAPNVKEEMFVGPHPAGLPGTHIHFLDPVSENKTVWHIGYQEVIAIGHLFVEGEYYNKRYIALGGPNAKEPRVVETLQGASVAELTQDEVVPSEYGVRIISGSVLWGNNAVGPWAYLGRHHLQISMLEEGKMHDFVLKSWLGLGLKRHSVSAAFERRCSSNGANWAVREGRTS